MALGVSLIGDFAQAADPEGRPPPARALEVDTSLGLQATWTDNARLTADHRVSDLITRAVAALKAGFDTGRATARLDAQVAYDAYSRETRRSGWSVVADGAAAYALIPDRLTLKANGAISDVAISSFDVSAADRHGSPGRVQLTTYDVGPEFTARLADRMELTATARFAQVLYGNASGDPLALPRDDSMVQVVGALRSDPSRLLQLQTSAEYLHDNLHFTSGTAIQSAYLRATPQLRLIGRLGRERVTQGQALRIDAPLYSAGFEFRPTAASTITIEAARRYHRAAWFADALVQLSPRVLAAATYSEQVQPDQVGVARAFRAFVDAAERLPPPLAPATFTAAPQLANATSLYKTGRLRVAYDGGLNTLAVSAGWTDRQFLVVGGRDRTLLMDAVFTRRLRPDLTLGLRANFARTYESPDFGASRAVGGSAELAYRLNSHTDAALTLSHTDNRRLSANRERISETAVRIGLRRAF